MLSPKISLTFLSAAVFSATLFAAPYQFPTPDRNSYSDNVRALQQISAGVAELSQEAAKGVVLISISKIVKGHPYYELDPFDFFFGPRFRQQQPNAPEQRQKQQAGVGSGFIVDLAKGYIITNNHVIEGADEISLKLANGGTYTGKVLGGDKNTDVAMVQITDAKFKRDGLAQLSIGNSDNVRVGEFVIALGAPFGLEFSQSFGAVSATSRGNLNITSLGNFIQTDAAINPGNSGGPLINMEGLVIGMNTAIFSRSGASAGIGFAVPSNLVRSIAEQLVNKGRVARGYLGVQLSAQELDEELLSGLNLPKGTRGALVSRVEKGTPAAKAGLESGDVIVEVNGRPVHSGQELSNVIGLSPPQAKVPLSYYRNGKLHSATVTLGDYEQDNLVARRDRPDHNAPGPGGKAEPADFQAGLKLEPLNKQKHAQYIDQFGIDSNSGLLVLDVDPSSKARASGIRPGDVLLKANQTPLKSVKDLMEVFKSSNKVFLQLERSGNILFASIRK
ncbi:Do family serine endopeptidase [Oligoflexus tunisiensis]|uniref:Do family serine endopeptidase n=1 Tax=Oligoflexus tunisiensis TaxID=708132 RepID=UPI00159F0ED7|nr:Do family serine endopeptidase [Oligoflexus tunisiensis]